MSDLQVAALALLDRLAAARSAGSSEAQLVELVLGAGWRPVLRATEERVLDGVLADGRHVPVTILRAS